MKLNRIFIVMFLFCLNISTLGFALQFNSVKKSSVYPMYEYFAHSDTEDSWVAVGTILDEPSLSILVKNIPATSGDLGLFYLDGWSDFHPYTYVSILRDSAGFPLPGPAYESIEYIFYVDANGNRNFDPGELNDTFTIPSGSQKNLGFVGNVSISDGNSPTLTWNGIDGYNDLFYRIRIFRVAEDNNPDKSDLLFESEFLVPVSSNSFSYTYTGDLFSENEKLSFAIEATEVIDGRIMNQSRYFINLRAETAAPIKSMPCLMLLLTN